MYASVGSAAWAARGGALRPQDRMQLLGQLLLSRLGQLPVRLRVNLGFGQVAARQLDLSAIRAPDSEAAVRTVALVESLSSPALYNHCLRTYIWGALLAQAGRIAFDEELFFVASLFHDIGLTPAHNCQDSSCACFAVEGARAAQHYAVEFGWKAERCERLAEAISLHLTVRVGLQHGAEAHLLHEGAALDVIGARLGEIDRKSIDSVIARYPRLGIKAELATGIKEQARLRPHSRAAFLARLGFIGMLRANPLADEPLGGCGANDGLTERQV